MGITLSKAPETESAPDVQSICMYRAPIPKKRDGVNKIHGFVESMCKGAHGESSLLLITRMAPPFPSP
jgi:hypothetical protein